MIAFGTIAGGAGAALTGGNFWQGAVTGLVVSGLNHAMDHGDGPGDPPTADEKAKAEGWTNSEFKRLYEFNETFLEARTFFTTFELKLPALKIPNWFKTTGHGTERLAGNLATRGGVLSLTEAWTTRVLGSGYPQAGGGTVYLRQLSNGRYNAVVWGERGIITTMKGWSQKSINRVAKNYGWKL